MSRSLIIERDISQSRVINVVIKAFAQFFASNVFLFDKIIIFLKNLSITIKTQFILFFKNKNVKIKLIINERKKINDVIMNCNELYEK